jgi:carboxyl-terminal processing protease
MKIDKIITIIGCTLLLCSCEKSFLEEERSNDPETNFEIFWKEFDEHYALFEYKNVNWQDEYNQNRPLINSASSNEELWNICTGMIEKLDDSHTFIIDYYTDKKFFLSGGEAREHAKKEFSRTLIKEKYLNNDFLVGRDTAITSGLIHNTNVAYIHFNDMQGDYPQDIQTIAESYKETDGMIIDLRNNGGGTDTYSHTAAGAFSDGKHFIYTVQSKNGKGHTDFDSPRKWYTEEPEGYKYLKPIVLITDRQTISAGEIFCFNIKAFAHVYHIGDNTSGAQSDLSPIRTLPNGWAFGFSYQKYLTPDGKSFEGVGIAPDYLIKNTDVDIDNKTDMVLEYAIGLLD